jgi:hypothetical protein
MAKKSKKNWKVRIECVVEKEIYCDNCTEEEAYKNPWAYATDEIEVNQSNWEVKFVKENY